jgi:hypothetical protein
LVINYIYRISNIFDLAAPGHRDGLSDQLPGLRDKSFDSIVDVDGLFVHSILVNFLVCLLLISLSEMAMRLTRESKEQRFDPLDGALLCSIDTANDDVTTKKLVLLKQRLAEPIISIFGIIGPTEVPDMKDSIDVAREIILGNVQPTIPLLSIVVGDKHLIQCGECSAKFFDSFNINVWLSRMRKKFVADAKIAESLQEIDSTSSSKKRGFLTQEEERSLALFGLQGSVYDAIEDVAADLYDIADKWFDGHEKQHDAEDEKNLKKDVV